MDTSGSAGSSLEVHFFQNCSPSLEGPTTFNKTSVASFSDMSKWSINFCKLFHVTANSGGPGSALALAFALAFGALFALAFPFGDGLATGGGGSTGV